MKAMNKHLRAALLVGVALLGQAGAGLASGDGSVDLTTKHCYPDAAWTRADSPAALGWSTSGLEAVAAYVQSVQSAAVMIVQDGVVVASWGKLDHPYSIASGRKSLLSALIGNAVGRGELKLQATLEQLGIDDLPPSLTHAERQARVVDLLTTRSGIFHRAAYEPRSMRDRRPERGSHPPGTFFFYNNWDFNTLGTIYEQATGRTIFEAFHEEIAAPIGMQDFRADDCRYVKQSMSEHAAYLFRISARDLARFGLLFLREGKWQGRQVVPSEWVKESTAAHVLSNRGAYGYMWWVETETHHYRNAALPAGSYMARGAGGHHLIVVPALDLVVVHQGETDQPAPGNWVGEEEVGQLLQLILAAKRGPAD